MSIATPNQSNHENAQQQLLHELEPFYQATLRVAYSGIKFFYTRTCKRDWQTLQQMKLKNVRSLVRSQLR